MTESSQRNKFLAQYVSRQLNAVNHVLFRNNPDKSSIDEIVVMDSKGAILFTHTNDDREVHADQLKSLTKHFKAETDSGYDPVIVSLDGQDAEKFDIMVPVTIFSHELEAIANYFVFGNYLNGTLMDLQASPRWIEAQNLFFCFAESLCELLHNGEKGRIESRPPRSIAVVFSRLKKPPN